MSSSVCRLRLLGQLSRPIVNGVSPRRIPRRLASHLANAPPTSSEAGTSGSSLNSLEEEEESGGNHSSGSSSTITATAHETIHSRSQKWLGSSASSDQTTPESSSSSESPHPTFFVKRKSDIPSVEPHFAQHLEGVFPSLQFPPELARRMLTHASHPAAMYGHNGVYGFLGRRVLESYLLLFLHSSSALKPSHDIEDISSRALNAYVLGEHIGSQWGLGRILRWTPTVSPDKLDKISSLNPVIARSAGLYKVQGDTVAAVLGGIFYQFGASTAQRVFHTRILPYLFLGSKIHGLPEVFRREAVAMSRRMGGPKGNHVGSSIEPTQSEEETTQAEEVVRPRRMATTTMVTSSAAGRNTASHILTPKRTEGMKVAL